MRYFIAASACAVALLGFAPEALAQATGPAANTLSGHVGVQYDRGDYDQYGFDEKTDFYTLEGALRFGADVIGGSVDGRVTYSNTEGYHQTAIAGTAHVNARLGEGLVGAFAGGDRSDDLKIWGVGLEAQANLGDNLILYTQLGYGQTKDLFINKADVWAARADIRLFPTDNLKLQASGGYQRLNDAFYKSDAWMAGVEGEYQIPKTGLSLVAGYDHWRVDDLDLSGDIFRIGARYAFGATSLRQRERSGESLGTVQRLFSIDQFR
jgi:hypothetical protein